MLDVDARGSGGGGGRFVKKRELRQNGPRACRVADVTEGEGFPDENGNRSPELVLVFEDGTKQSLRAKVNRDAVIEICGPRTSRWIGQTVELYFDPGVFNPRGGEPGGIRIRRPAGPADYVSDLEHDEDEQVSF